MGERRLEHGPEVARRRDVGDRVVDEDGVERPAEANRAHVALDVLALGVEAAADGEHLRRPVDEREPEGALEVRRVVPAAAAELEDVLDRPGAGVDQEAAVLLRLRCVVLGGGQQRPPFGELSIELGTVVHPGHPRTRPAGPLACRP
jgi:hypothetical protein